MKPIINTIKIALLAIISANALAQSNEFNYPVMPDTTSTSPEAVGAIAGTFDVSATGAATYTIPISIPAGHNGLQPSVAITYNSQAGNGLAGWGCNIAGISAITRGAKTIYHDGAAKGITHDADDAYYLDGQRLILTSGTAAQEGAIYYPENDPFTKIIAHGIYNDNDANTWFEVEHPDGRLSLYWTLQSYNYNNKPRIHAWYLSNIYDTFSNRIEYSYQFENNFVYPATISYGYNENTHSDVDNKIVFEYETRPDSSSFVMDGNLKGVVNKRLKSITSSTADSVFRKYELTYSNSDHFSRLTKVTEKNGANEALKPTTFSWEYLPSFSQTATTPQIIGNYSTNLADQAFSTADLNGDGVSDIISFIPSNNKILSQHFISTRQSNGQFSFETSSTQNCYLPGDMPWDGFTENKNEGIIAFNAAGDGKQYLLIPFYFNNGSGYHNFCVFLYNHEGKGVNSNKDARCSDAISLQHSSEMPAITTGDIFNNGKDAVVCIEKGHTQGNYPVMIGEFVKFNTGDPNPEFSWTNFNLILPGNPEKLFLMDCNSDGLNDLVVFCRWPNIISPIIYCYKIFWNNGTGIPSSTFSNNNVTSSVDLSNSYTFKMIRIGDFNGDGLADFLMNATDDRNWYFKLNNGNGTFTSQLACSIDAYDQTYTDSQYNHKDDDKFSCLVFDFDYDGKSDVVITKGMYKNAGYFLNHWIDFVKTRTFWMRSTGSSLDCVKSATSDKKEDAESKRFISGDFNGDGQTELMNYGYNCYSGVNANVSSEWHFYHNDGYATLKGKIRSIVNGLEINKLIQYYSLVKDATYSTGTSAAYPVLNLIAPIHVVKSVQESLGPNGIATVGYKYGGLKVHLQGKGLMGMTTKTVTNPTMGTTVTDSIQWNTSYFIPQKTISTTTIDGKTAKTEVSLSIIHKGQKKLFVYPSQKKVTDLDGNIVTAHYNFDTNYGYITKDSTVYASGMYKTTRYEDYFVANRTWKPQLITSIQKHTDDPTPFVSKILNKFDWGTGRLDTTITNFGSSMPLTTVYTYDSYGNISSSKSYGSGVPAMTTNYRYDATNRFVTKISSPPHTQDYTYDLFGNVLTEKRDENIYFDITTHQYDGWGNRTATIFPDGTKTKFSSGWDNHLVRKYYTLTQGTGQPWIKTWYDRWGREVETETIGPKNISVKTTTTYSAKGQIKNKQTVTGALTTSENYTYDTRGRIDSIYSNAGQSVKYIYGNRSVTTKSAGKTVTKTYDARGNVKTVTDPATTINYTYKSLGKPSSIEAAGAVYSLTYNDLGQRVSLDDPSAGLTTYQYNAAGQVTLQTDARNNITQKLYDRFGRDSVTIINNEKTYYTYDKVNSYVRAQNVLSKVQTGNNYIRYYYDDIGRITTETRYIEGTGYSTGYTYNSKGQLEKITYPDNFAVWRHYDAYGNFVKVTQSTATGATIWELTGETGLQTTTKLGNSLTRTVVRDNYGYLDNIHTVSAANKVMQDIEYIFNYSTGNIKQRMVLGQPNEEFQYDNLDRLTKVHYSNNSDMEMTYYPSGNIGYKTGLGNYLYGYNSHAVSEITNSDGLIPDRDQEIEYNGFNKVSKITEYNGANTTELSIIYGPDRQRWKTSLKKNNTLQKSIVFAGNQEIMTEGSTTRRYNYIEGGDGLAAIAYSVNGGTPILQYALTDHQGSICKLVTAAGGTSYDATYDAWGKQTVLKNGMSFHRGYTGHEHLSEFNLINMNGRMYDPLLSRFLSPDPFVTAPDFSQAFNRYTYALNNPLKYTDPDGNNPLLIGMLISGVVNVLANWNDVNSFADGFLYFSIGMSSGFFGAAAGGAMASSIVTGGFIGGAASGAVGGFAGGFIGGAGNAFMYGQNPLKAGLVGGTIGAPIGAITGGLIRGIYDNIHGYDFWNGSKTTNFELGGLNDIDVETAARFGKQYDASPSAEVDTDVLKDKMQKVFGVREGHYKAVITSKTGGFGMSSYGSYVDLETNEIVGGYVRSFSSGYQELHISPRFINGDIVGFKAIAGHELGHVIHNYSIPHTYGYKLFHQYSERACYQYTYNVYSNAGRWQDALNTYINAYSRNYWGYYPSIYKLPF